MMIGSILKATGLAFLLAASSTMGSPAVADGKALGLTGRAPSTAEVDHEAHVARQFGQFVPILQGLEGVLQYASETFAAQIEGAATSVNELKAFCRHAPALTPRLAQEGYNITVITDAICTASKQPALKSNADIQALTLAASTKIWVVQALGSTLGNSKALCNAFSAEGGDLVGLNGTFAKQEICGVAG